MMGFFVILLAMNMVKPKAGGIGGSEAMGGNPTDSMLDFVIAVREGFKNPISLESKDPREQVFIRRILEKKQGDADQDGPAGEHQRLQSQENGSIVRPNATIPFEDGSALLTDEAREIIASAAEHLRDHRWIIEVRGHASPFESMRNPVRGRQLSYERAMAVANAMVDGGITWETLRVSAMGDASRIVPRARDRESDRTNQRVEVIVTNDTIASDPYARADELPSDELQTPPSPDPEHGGEDEH
jgi:outer membrane protein OmpA-like peptidoglycan-associated protein